MVGRTAIQIPPVLANCTDFLTFFRWTVWVTNSYQMLDIHMPLLNSCILTLFLKLGPYLLQKDRGTFGKKPLYSLCQVVSYI